MRSTSPPPSSHASLGNLVARAGKPCCIEKPMSVRLHEAESLVRAFEQAGQPLFVSTTGAASRASPMSAISARGPARPPTSVEWRLARPASAITDDAWRLDPREAPGGCSRILPAMAWISSTTCWAQSPVSRRRIAPAARRARSRQVEAAGGTVPGRGSRRGTSLRANAGTSCASHAPKDPSPFPCSMISRSRSRAAGRESVFIANPIPIQLPHVANLNLALREGVPHPSTGKTALRTAIVSEAILHGPRAGLRRPPAGGG